MISFRQYLVKIASPLPGGGWVRLKCRHIFAAVPLLYGAMRNPNPNTDFSHFELKINSQVTLAF